MALDLDRLLVQDDQRAAARMGKSNAWNRGGQYRGPRPDAEPNNHLPTYHLSDPTVRLSRRCPNGCGPTLTLDVEDSASSGRIVCAGMCGRQFAWTLP